MAQSVRVPNNWVLGFGYIMVIIVQVLGKGKYMIIRYLDPQGGRSQNSRSLSWDLGFRV